MGHEVDYKEGLSDDSRIEEMSDNRQVRLCVELAYGNMSFGFMHNRFVIETIIIWSFINALRHCISLDSGIFNNQPLMA